MNKDAVEGFIDKLDLKIWNDYDDVNFIVVNESTMKRLKESITKSFKLTSMCIGNRKTVYFYKCIPIVIYNKLQHGEILFL